MKITWIVLDDITAGLRNNSTYTRASLVAPYMPNTVICSTLEFVRGCDVIIYQDRFQQHDVYLAEELVKAGKIVLIDISFPVWNSCFPMHDNDKAGYFRRLANLSSCIIDPVDSYKVDLEHYIKDKPIKVIPNRLDLGLHLNKKEFNRLGVLRDFDVERSAKEYMYIISEITECGIESDNKTLFTNTNDNYPQYTSKNITFIGGKKKHVHIRDVRDSWIMQIFGDELAQLNDKDIHFTIGKSQNFKADINYYINWTNNQPCLNELKKTKCDIILFTHFEEEHFKEENKIIKWADLFTCMSKHGEIKLKERDISNKKISVIESMGISTNIRKKITIGWAGRPYYSLSRKNSQYLIKLAKDLDNTIFKFVFYSRRADAKSLAEKMNNYGADIEVLNTDYDCFLNSMDYYISPSNMEGGPMDMLNAFYAGIPVIAKNVGFFHTLKTKDDFMFSSYTELLKFFKSKERAKTQKIKVIEPYTWDNFRKWHINYFRKVLDIK